MVSDPKQHEREREIERDIEQTEFVKRETCRKERLKEVTQRRTHVLNL